MNPTGKLVVCGAAVGLLAALSLAFAGQAGAEPQAPPAPAATAADHGAEAAEYTPPAYGPGPVLVLKLDDENASTIQILLGKGGAISRWNLAYIRRALEQAKAEKAALLLLEITTNGGRVDITQNMMEALAGSDGVRTVAYVRRGISAGSMVALACDDIYMEKGSIIGATTPVSMDIKDVVPAPSDEPEKAPDKRQREQLDKHERKVMEALTRFFRAKARAKGHSPLLAAAMMDQDIDLLEVTFPDGRSALMSREEYDKAVRAAPAGQIPQFKVRSKPLTLESHEAVKWGLARAEVASRQELLKLAGLADRFVVELVPGWADRLSQFVSSALVTALLIAMAMLALYVELNHPSGVAAGVFLLALAMYFWANHVAGAAGGLSIVLFLAGAALLAVEIFFIPGFGVTGVLGLLLMLAGLVSARLPPNLVPKEYRSPVGFWAGAGAAAVPVLAGIGLGAVSIALLMRFFPRVPLLRHLVLKGDLGGAVVTAAAAAGAAGPEDLVGRTGTALTTLRPGGTARFGELLVDVVSDGEFLEAGTSVRIASADSNRIVVRRA